MNWIQGIQRAIDYVESNITEEIYFEEVAAQAYSSSFHFQRVFSILCGFSLGDYIRMRRLSLAGEELSKGNAKIIDIALKYGYDTPESFSRAFTRFHGIAPSEARHGGSVKIFTPLSVKLTLTGGSKMDYRIVKRDAFQVVCKRKRVEKPQSANATPDITAMWQEYGADGTMAKLVQCMPENPVMKGLLGICFSSELNAKQFPYGIGVEYDLVLIHQCLSDYYGAYHALEDLYAEGKIRAIGISNFSAERMADIATFNKVVPAVNQVETHLFWQQYELHKWMGKYNIQHEAWGPLAQHRIKEIIDNPVVKEIAAKYGKTPTQVALRFTVQRGIVVIPKTTSKDRMKENLDLFDFSLDDGEIEKLKAIDEDKSLWCAYDDPMIVEYAMS